MKLEQQLTPLRQARRLEELGFKGESLYYWTNPNKDWENIFLKYNPAYEDTEDSPRIPQLTMNPDFYWIYDNPVVKYRAYSVLELMDALPATIRKDIQEYSLCVEKVGGYYMVMYYHAEIPALFRILWANLADALSDMLIRLIEQGLYIVNKEQWNQHESK